MPYLSASAVVIHYEEALYQVYASLPYLYFYLCCGWPDDLKHSLPDNLSNFNRQLQALVENVFVFSVRVQLANSMCFDDALYKFTYLLTSVTCRDQGGRRRQEDVLVQTRYWQVFFHS